MAALVPYSRFRAVDDDNEPLVGGLVYSYLPGTSTPKATYTDHTLGTPNANPVVLDANGEATIFIDGATDLVLRDSADVQQWGPIRATDASKDATLTGTTLAGTLTVTSTSVTWDGNPTHSGNHTFTNNVTVNGNTSLGNASTDTLAVASAAVTWSATTTTHSGTHKYSAQPGFSAYTTVAFNIGQSSTPVDVVYATEDFDNGGCYNTATGVFTAPVAGRYRVHFSICPSFASGSSAGTTITADMVKNASGLSGRATIVGLKTIAGATAQVGPTLTYGTVITLAASDTLKWRASYSDATSIQCVATPSVFSVELVG